MKKIFCLLASFIALNAFAQDNPCNPRTTEWQPVLSHSWGTVWVKITYTDCTKDGDVCGWPLVRLQHSFSFPVKIGVELEGVTCENKRIKASFSTGGDEIAGRTEYKSNGNWHIFKNVERCTSVEVSFEKDGDRYEIKKQNGITLVYKNNSLLKPNGLTEMEEQKKKEDDEKKAKEEAAEKEKKLKAEKAMKNENEKLESRIQADINAIPAKDRREQLQQEFDDIRTEKMEEAERNEELSSFHDRVKAVASEVKANLEEFKKNKEERETQITNIREENDEIRDQQKEIGAGLAMVGTGLLSFKGRQGKGSSFSGPSYKLSIKGGLHGAMVPLGYTEYQEGTIYRYNSGTNSAISEKTFREKAVMAPGLYLTTEFHPLFSNNFSIGITGSVSYCLWPEANDGTDDATINYAGNSRSTMLNYDFGAELTAGLKPVKFLVRYQVFNQHITSSGIESSTFDGWDYSMESETYYAEDQKWKQTWAAVGLRFGDYTRSRGFLDLAFTRYIPTKMNGIPTTFQTKDLVNAKGKKIPFGGYAQFSQQNGWFVRAVYTKDNVVVDEEQKLLYRSKKPFITLTIGKSLEWFGNSYFSKNRRSK